MWIDPWGWSCSSDARKLQNELGSAPGPNHQAHHIVMSNSSDPRMKELRKKMAGLGIDINSAENGVWLPNRTSDRMPGSSSAAHRNVHTNDYKQKVFDTLSNAKDRGDFETKLDGIRKALLAGTF